MIDELLVRVLRAGAAGELVLRGDSGFWPNETFAFLGRSDVHSRMAVGTNTKGIAVTAITAITAIDQDAWIEINFTNDGQAQVAECVSNGRRLIVRRTRLTDRYQAKLWPDWRHFGFLTDPGHDHVASGNFSVDSA